MSLPVARVSRLTPYALVIPAIALLIAVNIFPLLYTIWLSFHEINLLSGTSRFNAGANFGRVFSDPAYASAIRTTALFVVLAVSIELVLGYVLALAIHRKFPGKTVVLTIMLIPMMLSPAVMGLFWGHLLSEQSGMLNQLLGALGIAGPRWQDSPGARFAAVVLIDVWMWTPFMMLISLAALGSIPNYIYEAAEIDRASRWLVFRRLTLPMCAPLLGLAVLLRVTDALKQFDIVMAVVGPNDATTRTLSVLLYQRTIQEFNIGIGAAYALVVLVIVIALASLCVRYLDRLARR
jgi:multiple sugar transport system permease protein